MPNEIERKFLVASDDWKKLVTHSVRICDGLIAASYGQKMRVRIAGHNATITVKGKRTGLVRPEFEHEIPISHAEEMLRTVCHDRNLEKTTYRMPDLFGRLTSTTASLEELSSQKSNWTRKIANWSFLIG